MPSAGFAPGRYLELARNSAGGAGGTDLLNSAGGYDAAGAAPPPAAAGVAMMRAAPTWRAAHSTRRAAGAPLRLGCLLGSVALSRSETS